MNKNENDQYVLWLKRNRLTHNMDNYETYVDYVKVQRECIGDSYEATSQQWYQDMIDKGENYE